ncbi:hypothetical protein SDC9_121488 [bioreactor metagenome]|uniref:Uncharacterized protein n=1 Tax=bioreactor metagenome TaxID=1076179 RepID=A0A645CC42_9ZZZZ
MHQRAQRCGGGRADDAPQNGRFVLQDDVSVGIRNAVDYIRLHQYAAVDGRAERARHFNGRHGDRFAKGQLCQIACANVFAVNDFAGVLAGNAALGGFAEAEAVNIVVECVNAHIARDIHHRHTAGIAQRFRERLRAVAFRVPAGNLLQAVDARTAAFIGFIQGCVSAVQRGGNRNQIEHRARFIRFRYDLVFRHGHQFGNRVARRIVQVERRIGSNCEDFAGIRVHNNPADARGLGRHIALLDVSF